MPEEELELEGGFRMPEELPEVLEDEEPETGFKIPELLLEGFGE